VSGLKELIKKCRLGENINSRK